MNVFLILKGGFKDSYYAIRQISEISTVEKVLVFRDDPGYSFKNVEYILLKKHKSRLLHFILRYFQIIRKKEFSPKLIVGIYEIPHGILAMLTGKSLKVPSVISIIGNPGYKKIRKGLRLKLTIWILRKCDFITVTGSKSKQLLVNQGLPADKIYILPNTMDFTPYKLIETDKIYDIISLGRISLEKHIEVFIDVVELLKKKIPLIKAAIGGQGPEFDNISKLIIERNLESNIRLLGYIPEDDLPSFFNTGKIFILTSETEGFPRTIIQAAACGIPVISSNVGDMSDIIENNINGFLIDNFRNIEEYASCAFHLLNNNKTYADFSSRLKTKVKNSFDNNNAIKVWQNIIDRIT